jgi:hypothetical protein
MKVLFLILLSSVSFAGYKSIKCEGDLNHYMKRDGDTPGGIQRIQLEADLVTDWLSGVMAQVTYADYNRTNIVATGIAARLDADKGFVGTKNINHYRFDLGNLTEVKKVSHFFPGDECQILVLIPKDAMTKATFSAPTQIRCGQSGGVATLSCGTVKK